MNQSAIYKLSYGLYAIGTCHSAPNLCIVNSVLQVTSKPMQICAVISKNNYTNYLVRESGRFCVSVLSQDMTLEDIARFGFATGRDVNKLYGFSTAKFDKMGNPYLTEGCLAYLSCKVINQMDVGTHTLFVAQVVDMDLVGEGVPMTYDYYRNVKKGTTSKNAPTYVEKQAEGKYQCSVCGYVYEGDDFEQLPESYVCPVCKSPKRVFQKK